MHNGTEIVFDSANGHRLRLLNVRANDMALYDDLDDGSRVICSPSACDQFPRRVEPFAPVEFNQPKGELWIMPNAPLYAMTANGLLPMTGIMGRPEVRLMQQAENKRIGDKITNFLMGKFQP